MTYRYSVLFFLNLSLKHFFPHRKRQFLWKYPNPETVIVPCFNVSRMPNRLTSQSKIEDIVHCKVHQFAKLNGICPSYSSAKLLKIAQKWNGHWTCRNDPSPFLFVSTGKHVRTDRSPPRFICIVLHQFAKLNDNHPFTQVQNCPKFGKNEMGVQRVEVILLLFYV